MSAIAKQWTTAGLPANTPIDATNVNASGNGDEVALPSSLPGSAEFLSTVAGFRVVTVETGAVRRIDAALPSGATAFRARVKFTLEAQHTGTISITGGRTATAAARTITLPADRRPSFLGVPAAFAPAIAVGDTLLIDYVVAQSASPTASNGRLFLLFKNLTDPTWNETGEVFYDTGYTVDAGTTALTQVRFGKMSQETLPGGARWENLGWEAITVNPAHLSEAQARSYFADPPQTVIPVAPPTSGDAVPIAGPGTGTGWTVYGGAASAGHALADSSTATGIESPDATSTANEYILPLQKMTPRAGLTLTFPGTSLTVAGAAVTVRLYSNGTLVASKPLSVTTTSGSPAVSFSSTEVASVDWEKLSFGLRVVLS